MVEINDGAFFFLHFFFSLPTAMAGTRVGHWANNGVRSTTILF
jgi:hypothetical protein